MSWTRVSRGGPALQIQLANAIALRKDARHLVAGHDHDGADVLFGHQFEGLEHVRIGLNRKDPAALLADQVTGVVHASISFGVRLRRV